MYVEKKRPVALLEERLGRRGSPSQENEEGIVNKIEEKKKKNGVKWGHVSQRRRMFWKVWSNHCDPCD